MKDKISWIHVKCSKCKKDTRIPPNKDSKTALCSDCYHDKLKKFKTNWNKIKNYSEVPDVSFFDSAITNLVRKLADPKNKEIESYLKQLIVIKLVTFVEIRFRELMRYWIDYFSPQLEILFPNDSNIESILQDIRKYENKGGGDFLKESHAVANFNWQNLEVINKYFSKLLDLHFFKAIKDLDLVLGDGSLERHWEEIENLFELRNQVIHNAKEVELTNIEITLLAQYTTIFVTSATQLIDNYTILDNYDEGSDDITEFMGMSYEMMKQIISENRT